MDRVKRNWRLRKWPCTRYFIFLTNPTKTRNFSRTFVSMAIHFAIENLQKARFHGKSFCLYKLLWRLDLWHIISPMTSYSNAKSTKEISSHLLHHSFDLCNQKKSDIIKKIQNMLQPSLPFCSFFSLNIKMSRIT